MAKRENDDVAKKDKRRLEHIEQESKDYGRYGREPKVVPPKIITSTETMQTEGELAQMEIDKTMQKKRGNTVRDPVCGTMVNPETVEHKTTHEDKKYYFCCEKCLKAFNKDPKKYKNEKL